MAETLLLTPADSGTRNITFECHTKLEEGGAIYAWGTGKGNQFLENVVYKGHGLPAMIERLKSEKNHYQLTPEQIKTLKKVM